MIHKFRLKDKYIVLDVESSLVYDVDRLTYKLLDFYESGDKDANVDFDGEYSPTEVLEAMEEIDDLIEEGLLFSKEKKYDFSSLSDGAIKAMCLNVSHDCNLACKYCFAGGGSFEMQREVMNIETAKAAMEFLVKASKSRKNLDVDFFGGEPLLNMDVVKETVNYARSLEKTNNKKFRFTITTNGVLLDEETMDYLNQTMDNIVLSLDGRKEVNDHMRITRGGKGSYDRIVPNILSAVKKRGDKDYYVRGTYTAENLDFSKDIQHFTDLGIESFSLEPVVTEEKEPYAIKEENLEQIFSEYEKTVDICLKTRQAGKRFNFFHFNIELDNGITCDYKRRKGCSAGNEYVAVAPSGDIYPCHQFVGKREYILGNVSEGIQNEALLGTFRAITMENKSECKDCFAKYFCGGGCLANSQFLNGDIHKPYAMSCKMHRKRIECALYIKCKEIEKNQ